MKNEEDLRKKFIEEFIGYILKDIKERKYSEINRFSLNNEKLKNIPPHELRFIPPKILPVKMRPSRIISPPKAIPVNNIIQNKMPVIQQKKVLINSDKEKDISVDFSIMKKLLPLLLDPSVQSIECKGEGQRILVLRGPSVQISNITLSKEEINSLMKEISEKTRIPLIQGLFKAAFENFIITAVISDFVGTRFIIEKKALQINH